VKLVRFADGEPQIGVVENDEVRRLGFDYPTLGSALSDPEGALQSTKANEALALNSVNLLAPLDVGARVFAIAQNYASHAEEVSGGAAPTTPVIFTKLESSIVGPGDDIRLPPITDFLDYEGEMAVLVGRPGSNLDESNAASVLGGVTCFNDVSARDLQWTNLGGKEIVDWFSGKCLDRSSPLGPWVVSVDEAGEVGDLKLQVRLNGEIVQDDRTSSMVSSVAALLAYISQRVALRPGDVIATGTPSGVGRYRNRKLSDGDVVEVEVERVGMLRNTVRSTRT
jgi:2-keto-4-pentenoate hydratase/2-oxohepta-3-ene-1,7-dioic acid hydratase in catechol pathway